MSARELLTRRWILQLGNDQITPKACYYASELARHGFSTYYFSEDRSGLSQATIAKYSLQAEIVPRGLLRRSWRLLRVVRDLRPGAAELFLSVKPWHLLVYLLVLLTARIPIVVWCRGEIRDWESHHPFRRFVNRLAIRSARVVLLRELYMRDVVECHRIVALDRTIVFPNTVPCGPDPDLAGRRTVLYLNSLKAWRNPQLVVDAAQLLQKTISHLDVRIVGATSGCSGYLSSESAVEKDVRDRIAALGLSQVVQVLPFTDDPDRYYREAAVFLLPADLVFCNYSLLEAMARGVVPIVSDVEGADRIVEDGVSGFIVPRDGAAIADRVRRLLEDDELRRRMARAARERIRERFSVGAAAEQLREIYAEHWRRPVRGTLEPARASREL